MIPFEAQIVIALGMDLLFGDPRWLPHPVKLMGRSALFLEGPLRRSLRRPRLAGFAVTLVIVLGTALTVGLSLELAREIHPIAEDVLAISMLYTTFALKDLTLHAKRVYQALQQKDIEQARERVGRIVGRDTDNLDEPEIVRAAVESVAESTSDGVTAPLLFALALGPVGAMTYKAINTLDSTFGYKNERYLHFGFSAAKLDDLANYLPARITGLFMIIATFLLRMNTRRAIAVFLRDRRAHPSPNSGHTEAVMAGALGVQLGGESSYGHVIKKKPVIGDPLCNHEPQHILQANRLLQTTTILAALAGLSLRLLL